MEDATSTQPQQPQQTATTTTKTTTMATSAIDNHLPPKVVAEQHIENYAASLHQQLAPIVTNLGKEHIILLSKRDMKEKAIRRLVDDDNFIPRSARFNFSLNVSKRTETMPAYIALRNRAKEIVDQCGRDLKQLIISAANLELSSITTDIEQHLAKSIRVITQSQNIISATNKNCDEEVSQLLHHYFQIVTTNLPPTTTKESFYETYRLTHNLTTFPVTTGTQTGTQTTDTDHSDSIILTQMSQLRRQTNTTIPTPIPENITTLINIIKATLITAWQRYLEQQQRNKIALELKKLTTAYFTEQATEQAVLDVDKEPPADKQELKALIRQETKAETTSLEKKIDQLSKQIQLLQQSKNFTQRRHHGPSG